MQCKRYARANLQLATWAEADHVPSFEEYLEVAGVEVAVDFTIAGVLMAMKDICKKEAYEWLKSGDKLVIAMYTVTRVLNDIHGYEVHMVESYFYSSNSYVVLIVKLTCVTFIRMT